MGAPSAAPPPAPAPERELFAEVALPLPLRREFTYRIPPGLGDRVRPGVRVQVMFGRRPDVGVVTALRSECALEPDRLRPILAVVDHAPLVTPDIMALCARIAARTLCSLGEALDAAIPAALKKRPSRTVAHAVLRVEGEALEKALAELDARKAHAKQARLLRLLAEAGGELPAFDLTRRGKVTLAPLQALVKRGFVLLERRFARPDLEILGDVGSVNEVTRLTAEQEVCVAELSRAIATREYAPYLLFGVTGSGKTEVYLRAAAEVLAQGRSVLILVPEIALTPQTVARFRARCGRVAVLHSSLTEAQRADQWRLLLEGRARLAIGPRSALFAPVSELGLIVVDEEHESTFKQNNVPRYHAREMALERGRICGATVVLGSATPSLESWEQTRTGGLKLLELRRRVGESRLPQVVVVDLREEDSDPGGEAFLSRQLVAAMRERLAQEEQVILFLNRRGFSPVLTCPRCGASVRCEECSVSMTLHRARNRLVCHYCAAEMAPPQACPSCGHPRLFRMGFGTERVEAEVRNRFPEYPLARVDSDSMARRDAVEEVLREFRAGRIRILVGTQMIAKGLDFPRVTVVGVIAADSALKLPDFRSPERTFQLVSQVAGRAGRGQAPGVVVIQTNDPTNAAIRAAVRHDFPAFAASELPLRKQAGYPPFVRLGRFVLEGPDPRRVQAATRRLAMELQPALARGLLRIKPPAEAVIGRIKGRYRWNLLLKIPLETPEDALSEVLVPLVERPAAGVRILLDMDPTGLF